MMYLYVNNYIADDFSFIDFMLSTSLTHDVYKGHQIAIRRARFQFYKVSFRINMISTILSLTIKRYSYKRYQLKLGTFFSRGINAT